MIIKVEFDLKDESQTDALLGMLALLRKLGFHAEDHDTLKKSPEKAQNVAQ